MIRLTKIADYGFVLLARMAERGEVCAARELAEECGVPHAMTGRILKALAKAGLLASRRGIRGGYSLARPAEAISAADVVTALEGPIAIAECLEGDSCGCGPGANCRARSHWGRVNATLLEALRGLTLEKLARPQAPHPARPCADAPNLRPIPPNDERIPA